MKNEILKKMRTMILLLGVTLFFSSFVSSDDDYIIINCPGICRRRQQCTYNIDKGLADKRCSRG